MTLGSEKSPPRESIGQFKIVEPLGEGGMGAVWLAIDTKTRNRQVVIKFPHVDLISDPDFQRRFENEAASIIGLSNDSPSIVTVIEASVVDGLPYIVMNYLRNGSLIEYRNQILANSGPEALFSRKHLGWLETIAKALDFVHRSGIVHRDVKPSNILFDGDYNAYLADFGVAKVVSSDNLLELQKTMTEAAAMVGTLGYIAPETRDSNEVHVSVDQYALGVTLFEFFTGVKPFTGSTLNQLHNNQLTKVPDIRQHVSHYLEPSLVSAVAKSMAPNPRSRHGNCHEFSRKVMDLLPREFSVEHPVQINQSTPRKDDRLPPGQGGSGVTGQKRMPPPAPVSPKRTEVQVAELPNVQVETSSIHAPGEGTQTPPIPAIPKPVPSPNKRPENREPPPVPAIAEVVEGTPVPPSQNSVGERTITPEQLAQQRARTPVAASNDGKKDDRPPVRSANIPPSWKDKQLTCPWCWKRFDAGDTLWIAEHNMLHGDRKLPEEQQRFLPEKFNAEGNAFDLYGRVCRRLACPGCHLEFPRELVDFHPLVVSVLGVPSSGKSCMFASMAEVMGNTLASEFQFESISNPSFNSRLTEYQRMLFNSSNAGELVRLPKTAPDAQDFGYRLVRDSGQSVSFLQPYIFGLRPQPRHPNFKAAEQISFGLCFYDNSGEDFRVGKHSDENANTRHLIASNAVWLVFDPTQHTAFRNLCAGKVADPQFTKLHGETAAERQESVLGTALQILRDEGVVSNRERYPNPLVVILNKYDAWGPIVEGKRLVEPWLRPDPQSANKHFPAAIDRGKIMAVSRQMRTLMAKLAPELVHAAESFSENVVYLPISSFGRPVEYDSQTGADGVPANQLRPMWAEVPLIYTLSECFNGAIRKSN
jgi:serine/threonine protein kinase